MEQDLQRNGPVFLKQGETSQSLSLSDLFTLKNGNITPVLKVKRIKHLYFDYLLELIVALYAEVNN